MGPRQRVMGLSPYCGLHSVRLRLSRDILSIVSRVNPHYS